MKKVTISRYYAREFATGQWKWELETKHVSWGFFVIQRLFGWVEGTNPSLPEDDPACANARVAAMRMRTA